MTGKLGKGLCRSDAYAHRHPYPPADLGHKTAAQVQHFVRLHAIKMQERLVDGIYLDMRNSVGEDRHHTRREVSIECIIGRKGMQPALLHQMLDLKERSAHLYAHSLALVAARHDATVVVGKHNDRFPVQIRTEDPLA